MAIGSLSSTKARGGRGSRTNRGDEDIEPKKKLPTPVRDDLKSALTYFENRRHIMVYAAHVEQSLAIGSGVTEAASILFGYALEERRIRHCFKSLCARSKRRTMDSDPG